VVGVWIIGLISGMEFSGLFLSKYKQRFLLNYKDPNPRWMQLQRQAFANREHFEQELKTDAIPFVLPENIRMIPEVVCQRNPCFTFFHLRWSSCMRAHPQLKFKNMRHLSSFFTNKPPHKTRPLQLYPFAAGPQCFQRLFCPIGSEEPCNRASS